MINFDSVYVETRLDGIRTIPPLDNSPLPSDRLALGLGLLTGWELSRGELS